MSSKEHKSGKKVVTPTTPVRSVSKKVKKAQYCRTAQGTDGSSSSAKPAPPRPAWATFPFAMFAASLKLHEENMARILAKYVELAEAGTRKVEGASEMMLTPDETKALQVKRRVARREGGSRGARGPWQEILAMMGAAGGILGKYAMSTALQWLNPEIKFVQQQYESTVSTSGAITLINPIAQGLDYDDRIGNSIRALALEWRFRCVMHASATQTVLRVLLVLDTQTNESTPALTEFFLAGGALAAADQIAPDMVAAPERFAVLLDHTILLDTYHPQLHNNQKRNLVPNDVHTLFSGTGATDANISRGAIYLVQVSDQATNVPTVRFQSLLFFEDN